jgi:hypothetical protein
MKNEREIILELMTFINDPYALGCLVKFEKRKNARTS